MNRAIGRCPRPVACPVAPFDRAGGGLLGRQALLDQLGLLQASRMPIASPSLPSPASPLPDLLVRGLERGCWSWAVHHLSHRLLPAEDVLGGDLDGVGADLEGEGEGEG